MRSALAALLIVIVSPGAWADSPRPSYTIYGTPGLIDMPSARSAPDGELGFTSTVTDYQMRNTLSFQISDRLSGSFRYARHGSWSDSYPDINWDRSFDLRYRLLDEGRYMPAVAIGLQDFLGTGRYAAEYIVATKSIGDQVELSAGLGWGRLASRGGFENPLAIFGDGFKDRPPRDVGPGGQVASSQLFRGDAAVFGGVSWQINDAFSVTAEYSSDAYLLETQRGEFDQASPFNFGLTYRPSAGTELGLAYLHGTTLAFSATFHLNPAERPVYAGFEPAPVPVAVRNRESLTRPPAALSHAEEIQLQATLTQALALEGQNLVAMELSGREIRLRYENERYRAQPQALGRITRILTQALPPSIDVFVLEPVQRGVPLAAIRIRRSDIEQLESQPDASALSFSRAEVAAAGSDVGLRTLDNDRSDFAWGLAPYLEMSLFDPTSPVRADLGLELTASYAIRPDLVLSGAVRKRIVGNRDEPGLVSESDLPPVRRNATRYAVEGDPSLEYLTLTSYGRLGPDLYRRLSVGYLERMYGGVSTEVLWKPVDSRLALGAEVNYAVQRDFDMGLGFQDYSIVTGHASAYYAFDNGFHGQLDVGRYLAGDWGATISLDREFGNGWRVGAYATLTDVPFEDFGEGSFDKGIRITAPTDWFLGHPSRGTANVTLSSLTRDGGARLEVDGRLYEVIRDGHQSDMENSWGRFWR